MSSYHYLCSVMSNWPHTHCPMPYQDVECQKYCWQKPLLNGTGPLLTSHRTDKDKLILAGNVWGHLYHSNASSLLISNFEVAVKVIDGKH